MKFFEDFDPNAFFRDLIQNVKPMSQVEATYLMHALYNTSNGFFDHRAAANDAKSPFAVVRAFPEENPLADSLLEDLALRYKTNQIWERYKLNFLEYIALPMPITRVLDDFGAKYLGPIEDRERMEAARGAKSIIESEAGKK